MRRGIAAAMAGRLQGSGPCWLAASGTPYMLYPGEFVPQPIGRVKRFSTFAVNSTRLENPDGAKEQTQPAQKAPARIVRRGTSSPPSWHSTDGAIGTVGACGGRTGRLRRPTRDLWHAHPSAAPPREPRSAGSGTAAHPGRGHPSRSGALLPVRPPADRDHGRPHVRSPDRGVDRAARFAPGVIFSRSARKPIA
jgi:hypothetical protein